MLRGKKFAILQPSTAERFYIGLKLKSVAPSDRLEAAGSWNNMVTHRIRISDPKQIDEEVVAWLRQAYDAGRPRLGWRTWPTSVANKTAEVRSLYRKDKLTKSEIARNLGISRTSVRRLLQTSR
jgi:hypothetical protein